LDRHASIVALCGAVVLKKSDNTTAITL
jgi:hypothetical protein